MIGKVRFGSKSLCISYDEDVKVNKPFKDYNRFDVVDMNLNYNDEEYRKYFITRVILTEYFGGDYD